MAKIVIKENEIKLKAIKRILGREGYGFMANIYLNNKKIGSYCDYADGACGNWDFVSKETEKEFMVLLCEYAKTHTNEYIVGLYDARPEQYKEAVEIFKKMYPYIKEEYITKNVVAGMEVDYIMDALYILVRKEKTLKKWAKRGYPTIITNERCTQFIAYPPKFREDLIRKGMENDNLPERYEYEAGRELTIIVV